MNKDYHIENISVETLADIGKVICVRACPFEETPFGYCYITNKWALFNYPYSEKGLENLHHLSEREDYDVNFDNFDYSPEYGYIHKNCYQKDRSNFICKEIDLGLSVIWADRNYGAENPTEYGIMKSYEDLISENIIPAGWRLPTSDEFEELAKLARQNSKRKNDCYFFSSDGSKVLYLPPAGCAVGMNIYREGQWGEYLGIYSSRDDIKCKFTVATIGHPFVGASFNPSDICSIRFVKNK